MLPQTAAQKSGALLLLVVAPFVPCASTNAHAYLQSLNCAELVTYTLPAG